MNSINGKPSVFLAVQTPTPNAPVANWFSQYVSIANAIAAEAEQAENQWLADKAEQAEYHEYLDEFQGMPSDEELDSMAETHELSRLGAAAVHNFNGDDLRWQNGGVK